MFGNKKKPEETSGRYKVDSISGLKRAAAGYDQAVEKRLNEGDAKGWHLINTFASDQMVYVVWDTGEVTRG